MGERVVKHTVTVPVDDEDFRKAWGAPSGTGSQGSAPEPLRVSAEGADPSRWRILFALPFLAVATCWLLTLSFVRLLLGAMHDASFRVAKDVANWAAPSRDSDRRRGASETGTGSTEGKSAVPTGNRPYPVPASTVQSWSNANARFFVSHPCERAELQRRSLFFCG